MKTLIFYFPLSSRWLTLLSRMDSHSICRKLFHSALRARAVGFIFPKRWKGSFWGISLLFGSFCVKKAVVSATTNLVVTLASFPGFRFNIWRLGSVHHQKCWNWELRVCCKVFLGGFLYLFLIFLFPVRTHTPTQREKQKNTCIKPQ